MILILLIIIIVIIIKNSAELAAAKTIWKEQIPAKEQRIRRFDKRTLFFRQSKTFEQDDKTLFRELGKKGINLTEPPTLDEVEELWANI